MNQHYWKSCVFTMYGSVHVINACDCKSTIKVYETPKKKTNQDITKCMLFINFNN